MTKTLVVMEPLKIAKEFSTTPGPRHESEGPFSGEIFRKNTLAPLVKKAINENQILTIDLDGTEGYGTSFLEEAFGGLIRSEHISFKALEEHLNYISIEEPYLIDDIHEYLNDAKKNNKQTA